MKLKRCAGERLEALLEALEEGVLKASDREIMADERSPKSASREVKTIIHRQVRLRDSVVPSEPEARLQLLQLLARTQPDAPSSLRMAFDGGRSPSDCEIEELIGELLRLGVLDRQKR